MVIGWAMQEFMGESTREGTYSSRPVGISGEFHRNACSERFEKFCNAFGPVERPRVVNRLLNTTTDFLWRGDPTVLHLADAIEALHVEGYRIEYHNDEFWLANSEYMLPGKSFQKYALYYARFLECRFLDRAYFVCRASRLMPKALSAVYELS